MEIEFHTAYQINQKKKKKPKVVYLTAHYFFYEHTNRWICISMDTHMDVYSHGCKHSLDFAKRKTERKKEERL